jgi:altronate dehydratase small subunit
VPFGVGGDVESSNGRPRALIVDGRDSVATLLDATEPGKIVTLLDPGFRRAGTIEARTSIAPYHKIAIREMALGESVVKFGEVIGRVSCPIAMGEHVHVQNVVSARLSLGGP